MPIIDDSNKPPKNPYPRPKYDHHRKGDKHIVKCVCGKDIVIMTNVYDNSNSGAGHCVCGGQAYIN